MSRGRSASEPVRVAMTGFGSVGQALASIVLDYPELPVVLTAVSDRTGMALDPSGLDPATLLEAKTRGGLSHHPRGMERDFDAVALVDSRADILVEAASTNFVDAEPGWTYVRNALRAGRDVVLASKGSLVLHWDALFQVADENGCEVRMSATHGAPLPAIDLARVGLAGSRLNGLHALLNSTTGLILEAMETGAPFDQAVRIAGGGGVMETNPSLDIDGFDAAAKCVILTRSIFGVALNLSDVERTGIADLSPSEVQAAAAQNTPIKLVADVVREGNGVRAAVRPAALSSDDPLATLRQGALGIVYDADPVGPLFLAGYGKGGRPTAAAVLRDVMNLRRTRAGMASNLLVERD